MEAFDTKSFNYSIKDGTICVDRNNAEVLKRDNIVPATNISLNFLNLILENDDFFNYAVLVFSGNLKNFQILQDPESDFSLRSFIQKKKVYRAFVEAIRNDLLEFTDETRKRFHILKEMNYVSYYLQSHKDDIYELDIEGNHYSFKVSDFFSFLLMDSLELINILKNESEIQSVKKEYYLYALIHYFSSNFITVNYELPPLMVKNYSSISGDLYVDLQAVNVNYEDDSLTAKVKIDEDLEKYILSGMSDDFSLLEKCIYVYIKMCKIFTYDEEFYAGNQKGNVALKHKDVRHISEITLDNNSVVCYEFSKIYACILKSFGITAKSYNSEDYGTGHDNVEFRCDKYVILADAVTSIFSGDLFYVKLGKTPTGLVCLNKNADSQREFTDALNKITEYVKCEESFEYQESLKSYSLEDLLGSYHELTTNYQEIPLETRIKILMNKIVSLKILKGIDVYSYIKMLGNNCFSKEELRNNVMFEIVKRNDVKSESVDALPLGILVVNGSGFGANHYENDYYVFSPKDGVKQISYYTLKEYFENKTYEYIDSSRDSRIPGIGSGPSL